MAVKKLQHKIGETFEYDGFTLKCVYSPLSNKCGELSCNGCFFGYRKEYLYKKFGYII